jgi:hypothetical protein
VVAVHDRRRDVLDVGGNRVAEENEHDDRQDERESQAAGVTAKLNRLLARDRPEPGYAKDLRHVRVKLRGLARGSRRHRKILGY